MSHLRESFHEVNPISSNIYSLYFYFTDKLYIIMLIGSDRVLYFCPGLRLLNDV